MVLDAEFAHARHQALAIGLALVANEIGMRRAENDIDGVRRGVSGSSGMASIMTSMPLLGESRPNVRITDRPRKPSLAFASSGSTNGKSGMPCGMTSIFSAGTR